MKKVSRKNKKMTLFDLSSFTLIELIVVIAIISLFSGIVMAGVYSVRRDAKVTKISQEMQQLDKALQVYALDHNGAYPRAESGSLSPWLASANACGGCAPYTNRDYVSRLEDYLVPKYIPELAFPYSEARYYYQVGTKNTWTPAPVGDCVISKMPNYRLIFDNPKGYDLKGVKTDGYWYCIGG